MLATFIMTMRGTPYYYNGDELGMTNAGFNKIEDYQDMPTLNEYQYQLKNGGNMKAFMENVQFGCRDNGRTPFHWNDSANAGFTSGKAWLKINPNYHYINAKEQDKNPKSVLNYFRKIVELRKNNQVLVYGKYSIIDKNNTKIYAYTKELNAEKWLILLNFSNTLAEIKTGIKTNDAKPILWNYTEGPLLQKTNGINQLRPYESVIYRL